MKKIENTWTEINKLVGLVTLNPSLLEGYSIEKERLTTLLEETNEIAGYAYCKIPETRFKKMDLIFIDGFNSLSKEKIGIQPLPPLLDETREDFIFPFRKFWKNSHLQSIYNMHPSSENIKELGWLAVNMIRKSPDVSLSILLDPWLVKKEDNIGLQKYHDLMVETTERFPEFEIFNLFPFFDFFERLFLDKNENEKEEIKAEIKKEFYGQIFASGKIRSREKPRGIFYNGI